MRSDFFFHSTGFRFAYFVQWVFGESREKVRKKERRKDEKTKRPRDGKSGRQKVRKTERQRDSKTKALKRRIMRYSIRFNMR